MEFHNGSYDDDLIEIKSEDEQFNMYFDNYYILLVSRTKRMQELTECIDIKSYLDIILISLRALMIESGRHTYNYTLQNYLIRNGRPDLVQRVTEYLDTRINSLYTLREILKISTDKFLAHYDSLQVSEKEIPIYIPEEQMSDERIFPPQELFKRTIFMMDIMRDDFPFHIEKIVGFVQEIVEDVKCNSQK